MQRTNSANELLHSEKAKAPVQIPTCGRIVHYVPVMPDVIKQMNPSYCKQLPAIVVEASDLYANIVVFQLGGTPAQSEFSVPHLSEVSKDENGEPKRSYWKWPNE